MKKLEVFDPAMCCSTGICGTGDESVLVTFASDLEWLKKQGVEVIRYGLSFEPAAFVENEVVRCALKCENKECLPIIYVEGKIVSKSCYPDRKRLAEFCGVKYNKEEAPPVHREENCCCGVDCDCVHLEENAMKGYSEECDCSNAAAEDNCVCNLGCNCNPQLTKNCSTRKRVLVVCVLLFVLAVIVKISLTKKPTEVNLSPSSPPVQKMVP